MIAERLREIEARIAAAAAGRPVTLVAVSKTQPASAIREAHAAGCRVFGENYVQELKKKQDDLAGLDAAWHLVGRLQRNKARDVVGRVALIHSVDSRELAEALDRRAAAAGVTQDVLIEVNVAGEDSKAGVAPDALDALLDGLAALPAVRVRGLMTMPPPPPDGGAEANRPHFASLYELAARRGLPELSMGMTVDFEVAIQEGATLVRIGTAIFGAR